MKCNWDKDTVDYGAWQANYNNKTSMHMMKTYGKPSVAIKFLMIDTLWFSVDNVKKFVMEAEWTSGKG